MFNNKFNSTKKDPLVEAVQIAMQDGELRRQAEALVNEEFGVYSRNAVVREQLAAYDAAIEEAYKCMKEGEKKDEKKEDKPKADYSKMREKMVGKGKDLETTRKIVGEAKKLANKDYDKDGKIESPKDEVWGSRFRAAKMAGKMEEEQIDEISHKLALKAMKKSDERGEEEYDRDMTSDRLSDPSTHWDRAKRLRGHMKRKFGNKTIKTGGTDNLSSKSYEQGGGERRRADKLKKGPRAGMISARHRDKLKDNIKYSLGKHKKPNLPEEVDYSAPDRAAVTRDNKPSTPAQTNAATSGPSAADKAALTSKISTMKEAAYSAKAARAGKDIGKPGKSFSKIAAKAGKKYGSEERGKKVAGAILAKIRAKHMKEESSFNSALLELAGKSAIRGRVTSMIPRPPVRPTNLSAAPVNQVPGQASTKNVGTVQGGSIPTNAGRMPSTPSAGISPVAGSALSMGSKLPSMAAAATPTMAKAAPAPTPVKSVQTKGGAYPVFSKGSEAATGFKAAFDKAYAEKPGGTFKWKAAGETGPEREYKAVKAGEKPTTSTPAGITTDVNKPTENPTTARTMPSSMTGASTTTGVERGGSSNPPTTSGNVTPQGTSKAMTDPEYGRQKKEAGAVAQNVAESFVSVAGNKYRIV